LLTTIVAIKPEKVSSRDDDFILKATPLWVINILLC